MDTNVESKIFVAIIIISTVLLIISIVKKKFDLIIDFGLRIAAGLLAIYILNAILQGFNIDLAVGINALTALVIGILGLPGFVMLYGVALYFFIF